MSVCLMISNPINKEERELIVPIATERVFREFWMPVIETLDLPWAKCFQSGIEIQKEDFRLIIKELEKIKSWLSKNMDNEKGSEIINRLDNLSKEIILLENTRDDLKIYIG